MNIASAACLAVLLMTSCSSGHKSPESPAGEEVATPAPDVNAADEPAGAAGQAGQERPMDPDELALMHMAQVINTLRDLMHDCEAAEKKSLEYIERNKQAIVEGVAYGQNKEKGLQGQARDAYEDKMEALLNELAPDYEMVLESFGNACPDQKKSIGSAMGM
jgi:hypothetical protein